LFKIFKVMKSAFPSFKVFKVGENHFQGRGKTIFRVEGKPVERSLFLL
jgi:hypothetical protein